MLFQLIFLSPFCFVSVFFSVLPIHIDRLGRYWLVSVSVLLLVLLLSVILCRSCLLLSLSLLVSVFWFRYLLVSVSVFLLSVILSVVVVVASASGVVVASASGVVGHSHRSFGSVFVGVSVGILVVGNFVCCCRCRFCFSCRFCFRCRSFVLSFVRCS
jgi:hypothetical protein